MELITVPTFTFDQGDVFDLDSGSERPVSVRYYDGSIEMEQNGESIIISPKYAKALFKEVVKHMDEAQLIIDNHNSK